MSDKLKELSELIKNNEELQGKLKAAKSKEEFFDAIKDYSDITPEELSEEIASAKRSMSAELSEEELENVNGGFSPVDWVVGAVQVIVTGSTLAVGACNEDIREFCYDD